MAGKPPIWFGLSAKVRELDESSYGEGKAIQVEDGGVTVVLTGALLRKLVEKGNVGVTITEAIRELAKAQEHINHGAPEKTLVCLDNAKGWLKAATSAVRRMAK